MLFDTAVDRITTLFDVERPIAVSFVNERHKRMCGEAEFRLAETSFGVTVAGAGDYPLDDSIESLRYVQVNGGDPYIRANDLQMAELFSGKSKLDGAPGAFAMHADDEGNESLRLYPLPTVDGQAIAGWSVIEPADIDYGQGGTFLPPQHLHLYILDGAIADGHGQIESRLDLASSFEQRYELGVQKLMRYRNARLKAREQRITRGW